MIHPLRTALLGLAVGLLAGCGARPAVTETHTPYGQTHGHDPADDDDALTVSLRHVNTKERVDDLALVERRADGLHITAEGRRQMEHFLRDWKRDQRRRVPERLLWLLFKVARHYDAPIEVVSGYRSKARKSSRHSQGVAVDFRVKGVDPKEVYAYCKTFERVGLGYYPTSKFVHLDVRERSAYWIDDSGPGQRPRYRKGVPQPENDALRASAGPPADAEPFGIAADAAGRLAHQ